MYNITVKKYTTLKDSFKYDSVLNHVRGVNEFCGKKCDIMSMPYTNVKHCIKLLGNVKNFDYIAEIFELVFEVTQEDFYNAKITDYFKAKNHINEVFRLIVENENRLAKGGNTDVGKWKMAGGDKLANYDAVLPLDQLAERYGGYPFDLGRRPYSEIFYLMAMTKTLNEVNYNYTTMK